MAAVVIGWVIALEQASSFTFTFTVVLVRQLVAVREDLALKEN